MNTPVAPANTTTPLNEDSPFGIYMSGALGALFLGIGDLLTNQTAATVVKLSEALRQNLLPHLESGGLVALVLLVILGAGACFVQRPHTRQDAFARGFSVFALMAVTAPYHPAAEGINHIISAAQPTKVGLSSLFGISVAYAEDDKVTIPVEITLVPRNASTLPSDTQVTLRELDTGKIIGTSKIFSSKFSITQPSGSYLLEVEAPGLRRTAMELSINGTSKQVTVPIEDTTIPLSVQRLYAPDRVTTER